MPLEPDSAAPCDDLAEIDAATRAATPGPWRMLTDDQVDCSWLNAAGPEDKAALALFDYRTGPENKANAAFAVSARAHIARMIEELRTLRARIRQLLDANSKEVDRRTQALREREEIAREREEARFERDEMAAERDEMMRERDAALARLAALETPREG